ncbi:hypothetical protein [Clostridium thermobutyricum]|uniref:Uncharacterized protein n=1 Tax=Clostridium thermobutyricum DSM 4928 TaxID=1121339 RepID=A0A1V4SY45_9CLOT|nr:hypothetical protein [Clostridium thermobutyricum]OPX49755.1 hypothetical protein CLTHE_04860 [Clostridium thermobutyricum DSM 4928]
MKTKRKLIICSLIIFLSGALYFLSIIFSNKYNITILNNTNQSISNMELKFKTNGSIKKIPKIEKNNSFKISIDTSSIQSEDAIILEYKDIKDNIHKEYVVGYLEKGHFGNVKVIIHKINYLGVLDISINEN